MELSSYFNIFVTVDQEFVSSRSLNLLGIPLGLIPHLFELVPDTVPFQILFNTVF